LYQSHRIDAYNETLLLLNENGHTFPCSCTRKIIASNTSNSDLDIYPGTCRNGLAPGTTERSIRIRVESETVKFTDGLLGGREYKLESEVGDFVIKRADGLFAYHLAVVVDDAYQGITEIVRGTDLLDSTPHHLYLQKLLKYQAPDYVHLPVAVNSHGEKLSKQTYAPMVNSEQPGPDLEKALTFLGHTPTSDVINADPETLLNWAVENWNLKRVPNKLTLTV
jgi:glutamyl-Q tRNA(Asp) synthetase